MHESVDLRVLTGGRPTRSWGLFMLPRCALLARQPRRTSVRQPARRAALRGLLAAIGTARAGAKLVTECVSRVLWPLPDPPARPLFVRALCSSGADLGDLCLSTFYVAVFRSR